MPNTPSAEKRQRQNEKRRLMNRSVRSNMRSQLKKVRDAVTANDMDAARAEFRVAVSKLDRAAAHNLIHRNAAARTKSRLNKMIQKAAAAV